MDKKELFKKFLEENDVLIVDKNPSSRNRLLKTISDLGSKRHMIHSVASMAEAEQIIKTKKIGLVLSDYFITGGSGFDLFKKVRETHIDSKKLCQILVTSNISQTAVAKAAEEDVDSFIIKPYTIQIIQESLINAVNAKIYPSAYVVKIEEAKIAMHEGRFDEATSLLKDAMTMHSRPALALFYMGQVEYMKRAITEAEGNYSKGLSYNNIHFKCLIGLYELFMQENKYQEAYQVVKKVAKFFPANPDRLTQIVRLAIQTEHYDDMIFYYDIFTTLDERSKVLINYIGAGLYIAGKHHLINGNVSEALKCFECVAVSCSEFTKFLRAMITVLIENNLASEAETFLARFHAGSLDHEDYLVSEFLVFSALNKDPNFSVRRGLDLYNKKIRDFLCMKEMIEAMRTSGIKEDKLKEYRHEIENLFPERI
ncbi:MAG: response regulator [Bacteriovoracaceae bacterium]|jgi:CheY-like chemotaxis protein